MGKNSLNKILYKIAMSFLIFTALNLPVSAYEAVNASEIEIFDEPQQTTLENFNADINDFENNYLDINDGQPKEIKYNNKEFVIKNPFENFNKKKKQQVEKPAVDTPKEPDIQINCQEMEYFDETDELEARGGVEIITAEGTKAVADKAIYNKQNNTIKLYNNVILTQGISTIEGDYMFIDMNEENALMNAPVTKTGTIVITAQEGYAFSDRLENLNGNIELNQKVEMELASQGFTRYGRAINDKRLVDFDLKNNRSKLYDFKAKQIVIRPERDHDSMLLKNVDVYYKNKKILNVPSIEFFSDKERTYSEMNFPLEISSLKGFGMYLGLGYTFKLPQTYTFRLSPALTYGDDELGVGAIAQLKSNKTRLEAGWNSSTNNLIIDGEYKITDKLKMDVGRHAYKGEWFNGGNRAGYLAEISYDDTYYVDDLNAVFRHRISAGYVADYKREHQEDNMKDGFRYRYMAQLSKTFKTFGSTEQDMYLRFGALAQTMATVYSETGDTFGMVRIGPSIQSRVKHWNSNIAYMIGGIHGQTPYRFDEYRYGRQSVIFDESLILNKYISVGYKGNLTPLKDNNQKDVLTENRFYAVVGPDDLKIAFSYDTIRQNLHFDFLFLLGSDNLGLSYEKMTINNPDKIGKTQRRPSDKPLYKVQIPQDL